MTPTPDAPMGKSQAEKALKHATKNWRSAKKKERASREELAELVRQLVESGVLSEHKVANLTDIPRMTIRKMLGKDQAPDPV